EQLTIENEELRKQNKANEQRIAELETLLKTFQAKLFGTKSEKSTSVDENQLKLWDDDSVFTWSDHTDKQSTESSQEKIQKPQKRRKKRQKQIEGLEIVKNVKRLKEKLLVLLDKHLRLSEKNLWGKNCTIKLLNYGWSRNMLKPMPVIVQTVWQRIMVKQLFLMRKNLRLYSRIAWLHQLC